MNELTENIETTDQDTEKEAAPIISYQYSARKIANSEVISFFSELKSLSYGAKYIIDNTKGAELVSILVPTGKQEDDRAAKDGEYQVIRRANEQDLAQLAANKKNEKQAYSVSRERIIAHKLDMKLVSCRYSFDGNKATFYFTSDGRVDFRELLKDLAQIFRIRIELRQIGVRDEVKMIGALGVCGRASCCSTFLTSFDPVTIKMAKEQSIMLNPTKTSGVCGRLMCCLTYEYGFYRTANRKAPKVRSKVIFKNCQGQIRSVNIFKEQVTITTENNETLTISYEELAETESKRFEDFKQAEAAATTNMFASYSAFSTDAPVKSPSAASGEQQKRDPDSGENRDSRKRRGPRRSRSRRGGEGSREPGTTDRKEQNEKTTKSNTPRPNQPQQAGNPEQKREEGSGNSRNRNRRRRGGRPPQAAGQQGPQEQKKSTSNNRDQANAGESQATGNNRNQRNRPEGQNQNRNNRSEGNNKPSEQRRSGGRMRKRQAATKPNGPVFFSLRSGEYQKRDDKGPSTDK